MISLPTPPDLFRDGSFAAPPPISTYPRHRWYPFKEAFSPFIVEQALEDAGCDGAQLIFDPFCGSGTVPLTAILRGHIAIAYEVNPFLAFISRTKMHSCAPELFRAAAEGVVEAALPGVKSPLESFSTFSEGNGAEKWLFNTSVLRSFESTWQATAKWKDEVRDLMQLCLLAAAMETCNASRDGKCLRYKKGWKDRSFDQQDFVQALRLQIEKVTEDLSSTPITSVRANVHLGDVRQMLGGSTVTPFRLCVTSPPYLNSFDYSDVYRPELFLGKFVHSNRELMAVRTATVRSHLQATWPRPTRKNFGVRYAESINRIIERSDTLWDRRIPIMIQAYFEDLARVLGAMREVARADASVWMIVSTSAYAGIEIPVDLILADIACIEGWNLRDIGVLRFMRSSGQHWYKWSGDNNEKPRLRESVVILDA